MVQILHKFRMAVWASVVFAFSVNDLCLAQSTDSQRVDTPSQRWLPPVQAYSDQPDRQAKLLSQLRDLMLNSDASRDENPTRLSDSQVQSLKEAMKQFDGKLPDGLSADSLDAIPSDLISKALSNPELIRQAKELAEQFSKEKQPNASKGQEKVGGSNSTNRNNKQNASPEPQSQPGNRDNLKSRNKPSQPASPTQESVPNLKPSGEDFADLMEKLRNTQRQFEKNQNQQSERPPSSEPRLANPSAKAMNEPPIARAQPESPNPGKTPKSETTRDRSSPSTSGSLPAPSNSTERSVQTPRIASDKSNSFDSAEKTSREPNSQASQNARSASGDNTSSRSTPNSNSKNTSPSDSNSRSDGNRDSSSVGRAGETSGNNDASPTSSMNIRQELERSGFGPTLQKLIESAQRDIRSARVTTAPKSPSSENTNRRAESGNATPKNAAPKNVDSKKSELTTTKQPSLNLPRPPEAQPRPPQPDSAISKGLKQTNKVLNDAWTQISKSESNGINKTTSTPPSQPAASSPTSTSDRFSLPNPFNAGVLEVLLLLGVASAIVFLALRYKVRKEQIRLEVQEAKLAPKIDEIRTRDDIVRAFHAMTKKRFQSAQTWWTNRYVAEKFEHALPEYTTPIRTLSNIYEQARYLPLDHQLSSDQIEDAKLALKQCKG